MSVDLCCVDPKDVAQIWPYAGGMIRAAIERTNLSDFADVERDVLAGDQLLWLVISDKIEAAGTTHLSRGVCTITACGGHLMDRWVQLHAKIEKYAKDEGCHTVRLYGRKGWQRVLDGYKVEHVVMEKSL